MAGAGQLQTTAYHRTMQRRNHRHRAVLHAFQCRVPHARVVQALAGIALLQFAQIQAGAEVIALTSYHGGAHAGGHGFKQMAQGQDQGVVQCIALGTARQADDSDLLLLALQFKVDVFFAHGCFRMA